MEEGGEVGAVNRETNSEAGFLNWWLAVWDASLGIKTTRICT